MKTEDTFPDDFDNLERYAPTIYKMVKISPFQVPDGYFETLPGITKNLAFLSSLSQKPGFTVPENYFITLPGTVSDQLEAISKPGPGTLPEGYFENLSGRILSRIALEKMKNENPFAVPEKYFENLPSFIHSTIKLKTASEKESFIVPADYFEELSGRILAKVTSVEKPGVKIISIFRRQYTYLAAAASVALVIGFWYFLRPSEPLITDSQVKEIAFIQKSSVIENGEAYGIDESMVADILSESGAGMESFGESLELDQEQQQGLEIMLDNSIEMNTIDESGY